MAVTANDIRLIMNMTVTSLPDATVAPFLSAAGTIIDQVFADVSTDATVLEEIEKWFTAHMIASTIARMTTEEKLGDASVKYMGKYEVGLNSTPYGQMVLLLDVYGMMANMGNVLQQ
jgi:hypothetical protein